MIEIFDQKERAILQLAGLKGELEQLEPLCETLDIIPDDVSLFVQGLKDILPNDYNLAAQRLIKLYKDDRAFFEQIMALDEVLKYPSAPEVSHVSQEELDFEKNKEKYAELTQKIESILGQQN